MKSNLKVLHLVTSERGGTGIAAARISNALINLGVESKLVTNTRIGEINLYLDANRRLKLLWKLFSKLLTFLQSTLLQKDGNLVTPYSVSTINIKKMINFEPRVIHLHSFYNLLNEKDLSSLVRTGLPVFITLHDERIITGGCHCTTGCNEFTRTCQACPQTKQFFHKTIRNRKIALKRLIESSSNIHFICPSEWIHGQLMNSSTSFEARSEVIRNPISEAYLNVSINSESAKNSDTYKILFVSENLFNNYKGFDLIAECIDKFNADLNRENIEFIFIGKGDISKFDKIKIQQFECASEAEMINHYKSVDLILVPSKSDNSPNVIFESTICGTPFICSSQTGLPELAKHFDMLQFDFRNPKSLLEAIKLQKYREVDSIQLRNLSLKLVDPQSISEQLLSSYQRKLDSM